MFFMIGSLAAQTSGNADAVVSQSGVANSNRALGAPNNSGARLWDTGDWIVLDLTDIIPAGQTYTIRCRKSGGGADPSIIVEESADGTTFTSASGSPFSIWNSSFFNLEVTASTATRYLRFISQNSSNMDLDAVSYSFSAIEICGNGLDDDGDGFTDDNDADCNDCVDIPANGILFYADFENTSNNNSWTFGNGATDGNFVIDVPSPYITAIFNATQMEIAAHGGTQVLLTGSDFGQDLDGGPSTARSPDICLPNSGCYELEFFYYFADAENGDASDYLHIEIRDATDDSVLETLVSETGSSADNDAFWLEVNANLTSYKGRTIYIYVEAADFGDGSKTEVAIDDVTIIRSDCNEICGNGLDDDGDGLTDCADADCGGTSVDAGADITICDSESGTLNASGFGGISPYTFAWSNGLGSGASKTVTPSSTTTYTVTITNANGCTATDAVTISVNNSPSADAGSGASICSGETISLNASASGGAGPYAFTWSNGLGAGAAKTVSPTSTTTYTLTVSDSQGCTSTDQVTVTVNPAPPVSAGSDVTVCSGMTTNLVASVTGNQGPYSFLWSNGLGAGASKVVSPLISTTYTVTATSSTGCTSTDQVTVAVNQTPVANAGPDVTICKNSSATLTASASGGLEPYTFIWSDGLGSGATKTVSPGSSHNYSVTVTSANGCISHDQVSVTVQICPEDCDNGLDDDGDGLTDCDDPDCGPQADLGTDFSICQGSSATLNVSVFGGSGNLSYAWSNGLGSGSSKTVTPIATTTYTVTVTSQSGCTDVAQKTITVVQCGENCTNGLDDDGDGLVDCDDPDCLGVTAPMLEDDVYTTCPGIPFSERVTYNDGNLQNPVFSIYAYPSQGMATIDATGKFYYTPFSTECMTDIFLYQVCNQETGCCSIATVTLNFGDVTAPVLTNVPDDLTISCDDAIPPAGVVTAFDQCPGVFIQFEENFDQHQVGACESYNITRTWTATDFCGNTVTDQQKINVVDLIKPEIFQVYTLANGLRVVAGVSQRVTHDWKYVPFPVTFRQTPVIFTQVVSNVGSSAVVTQQRNIHAQGFELRLREQESADNKHEPEQVAWLAIEPGMQEGSLTFQAGTFANFGHEVDTLNFSVPFDGLPYFFSNLQTTRESDPVSLRHLNLDETSVEFFAQEEKSADIETSHANETAGILAIGQGSVLADEGGQAFGEMGFVNLTNAWATVSLSRNYTKPVVIIGGLSFHDDEPVTVRVRNVSNTEFQVRIQEWDYLDGHHAAESVSWMVVEGSIPGNGAYYCRGNAGNLKPGVNVFALDNCDFEIAFGFDESPSAPAGGGLLTARSWTATDDCGNTGLVTRYDTCAVAAVKIKALLNGAMIGTFGSDLMRDDLRVQKKVPVIEPYTELPGFNHVSYEIHELNPENNGPANPVGADILVCHDHGTPAAATISVSPGELIAHLSHGDMIGECGAPSEGFVTICHQPGTPAQKTMVVPQSSLLAHLGHGDLIGACDTAGDDIPAGAQNAQYRTIADGNWTDATTWENGNIPPTSNINNKTISIQHKVAIQNSGLHLKNNSTLWVTGGSLNLLNGNFKIEKSDAYFTNSVFDGSAAENIEIVHSEGSLTMTDCEVMVGKNIKNQGMITLENVRLSIRKDFENLGGVSSFTHVCAEIHDDFISLPGSDNYFSHVKFRLSDGNFGNFLGSSVSGEKIILLIEKGYLSNLGLWTAAIDQYCVANSLSGLLSTVLPSEAGCMDIANYFNPCNCYEDVEGENLYEENTDSPAGAIADDVVVNPGNSYGGGTIEPDMLEVTGEEAIVDWLLVELRDPDEEAEILGYASVVLQRDGNILAENGDPVIVFPGLPEGDYYVSVRHRNHLGLMTDAPVFLSIENTPEIDFTDPATPVKGGISAGRLISGKRNLWGGDFNEDGKVIYQGPYNDVFHLFSRVLADPENTNNLANFIVDAYSTEDMNLDGKLIYQGPNNDRASVLYHTVLAHNGNTSLLANYIAKSMLP